MNPPATSRPAPLDRIAGRALLALAVALTALVYWRVVRTFFFADDLVSLLTLVNRGFGFFVLQFFNGHLLVVRNAVFWATWQLAGFDPRPFYWSALLTHLLNVWLTYRVGRALTGSAALACLAAALWGTSPLCVGTLGWYAVYGQELVATCLLIVLDGMVRQPSDVPPSGRRVAGWGLLLLAGSTCFGTGIGVAMAFPLLAVLVLPGILARPRLWLGLAAFPLLVAGLYFGVRRLSALLGPLPASEVLLGAIAFAYVPQMIAMLGHLLACGASGLLLGFRFDPVMYPGSTTNAVVAGYVALLVAAAVLGDGTVRRHLLALIVMSAAAYALIAVGRTTLAIMFKIGIVSDARPLRYHYVGVVPLALALALALATITRRVRVAAPVVLALWLGLFASDYSHARWQIDERVPARNWAVLSERRIDAAVDAEPPGSTVYIDNERAPSYVLGLLGHTEFPGLAGVFMLTHPSDTVRGRTVRFVEHVLSTYFAYHEAGRFAGLMVSPDVVAGAPAP